MTRQVPRASTLVKGALAVAFFVLTWFLRYNDPEGSFGGLTDDHFFYVAQAWQMLLGELPDRDFVDPGAPLTFTISAALQLLLGRSVWSEYVFCVTALSLGAALTFLIATRATGSILLGVAAALLEIALRPRLYNYPKILVYTVAIPCLWAWASAPRTKRTVLVALVAAFALLMRHDHGAYVVAAFGILLLTTRELSWGARIRQGAVFALAAALFVAPYFAYLQVNGGIPRHFMTAYRWSQRDYDRAPLVFPTLTWQPLFAAAASGDPPSSWSDRPPFVALASYSTWWLYWFATLLPAVALLLLAIRPARASPRWANEGPKILAVITLAVCVNNGFLRGNLAGRLADVAVPLVVLTTWAVAAALAIARTGRIEIGTRAVRLAGVLRAAVAVSACAVLAFTASVLARPLNELAQNSYFYEGAEGIRWDAERVTDRLRRTWPLDGWAEESKGSLGLARYLESCIGPNDRVLLTTLLPQVPALARRGFAGGHVDLRGGGFFATTEDQELTIARLRRQSVPVVIGPLTEDLPGYGESLPLVADYLQRAYTNTGDHDIGDGVAFSLLVHRDAHSIRTYEPLGGLPCFQ
jgi:hypothetical protein